MINFYQNIETKEIISSTQLRNLPNWREEIKVNYTGFSEIHPKLIGMETIKIDVTHSQGKTDFINVPLNFILNNIEDKSLWDGCPSLFSKEIFGCIEKIIENGDFPYNRTVADEFCKTYNCTGGENDFLAAIVYTTQSYKHIIDGENNAVKLHEKLTKDGFKKLTNQMLIEAAGTKRKFLVYLSGQNILGGESLKQSENYLYLKDWKDQGFHWMKPQSKKSGYRAKVGEYVKELITAPKKDKPVIYEYQKTLF